MTTFNDRENAFENKYAHDEETKFKIDARTNKMLGEWAAELLGKTGDEVSAYVLDVIKSDFAEAGHEDVVGKVAGDFGGEVSANEVRAKRNELRQIAEDEIKGVE